LRGRAGIDVRHASRDAAVGGESGYRARDGVRQPRGSPMVREARLGIARLGAPRLGDYRPYVFLSVDGVARRLRIDHLTVRDTEGGIPNTATMRGSGLEPQEGKAGR